MAHRPSPRRLAKHARIARWRQAPEHEFQRLGIRRDALIDLELKLVGRIVLPGDPDYDAARQESNPAYQAYPIAIVYCEVEDDVRWCLELARDDDLWVAVRSGGHSTAGYSVNSGLCIDVSGLSYVVVDAATRTAKVGAGTDFDTLNGALNSTGLHVPSGACGNVCVGGFVQGGGYGYTSRMYGIQCDSVLAFRVMLFDGSIVNADTQNLRDLHWAMRGGTGGNFGVLLQVTYRLYVLPSVWAWSIQWNMADSPAVLLEMQAAYMRSGAPNQLGMMVNLGYNAGQPVLLAQGMYVGERSDGLQSVASLMAFASSQLLVDTSGPYGAMDTYLDTNPYVIPDPPPGAKEAKRAAYISKTLALSDWQAIVAYAQTTPNQINTAIIEPYGGAINAYPKLGSAFVHRDCDMDFFVDVYWVDDADKAAAVRWLEGYMALLKPFSNGHVYQNYPWRELEDFEFAYWGEAYPKLQQVKAIYDPENFFHYEQSIRPPLTAAP